MTVTLTKNRKEILFYLMVTVFFASLYFLLSSSSVIANHLCPDCTTDSCVGPKMSTTYKACSGTLDAGFTCGDVAGTVSSCSPVCGAQCYTDSNCGSQQGCIKIGDVWNRCSGKCNLNSCSCSNECFPDPTCGKTEAGGGDGGTPYLTPYPYPTPPPSCQTYVCQYDRPCSYENPRCWPYGCCVIQRYSDTNCKDQVISYLISDNSCNFISSSGICQESGPYVTGVGIIRSRKITCPEDACLSGYIRYRFECPGGGWDYRSTQCVSTALCPSPACTWSCSDWTPSPPSQSCGTSYTQTRTCTATNSPCESSNKPSESQSAKGVSCPYSGQSCSGGSCTPSLGSSCNDNNACTSGETYKVSGSSISCSGGSTVVCPQKTSTCSDGFIALCPSPECNPSSGCPTCTGDCSTRGVCQESNCFSWQSAECLSNTERKQLRACNGGSTCSNTRTAFDFSCIASPLLPSLSLSISISSTYSKGSPITAIGTVTSDGSNADGAAFEIKSVRAGPLNAEFCSDIFGSCPKTCTTANGQCSISGTISNNIPSGTYTIYGMATKLGYNPDSAASVFIVEQPSGVLSCSLSATPSIGIGPFSSTITTTYTSLSSVPNSIAIDCGDGNTATATGCIGNTGSCSATCNYKSVTSSITYTASASTAGIQCSTTAITNNPIAKACGISFSLQQIGNFDVTSKTANYIGKDYTWEIKASDASSSNCPASLTYSIPADTIVTIGSCDPSTGIYPVGSPLGSKINSFQVSRGKSGDVFKVFVKPAAGSSCSLSFGIHAPDGKVVDPIFTVTSPSAPSAVGVCNNNNACESGETQDSCPSDCKTTVTLTPNQIVPGNNMLINVDVKDGRYAKNKPIKLNLLIDSAPWGTALCSIDNVQLNPLASSPGIKINSDDRHVNVESSCTVPSNLKIGQHTLTVIPTVIQ